MQKYSWYKIRKTIRSGKKYFQIRVPVIKRIPWSDILEYLGENTEGGHAYGYEIKAVSKLKSLDPNLKVVKYPSNLHESLMPFGETVKTEGEMI